MEESRSAACSACFACLAVMTTLPVRMILVGFRIPVSRAGVIQQPYRTCLSHRIQLLPWLRFRTSRLSAASIKARLIFATSRSRTLSLACGSKAEPHLGAGILLYRVPHACRQSEKRFGRQKKPGVATQEYGTSGKNS